MFVHVLTKDEVPVATLHRIVAANITITANERNEGSLIIPSSLPELHSTTLTKGMLVRVYDALARLRLSGYIAKIVPGADQTEIGIVDLSEELRLIPLPPVATLNGYVAAAFPKVLSYVPAVNGERWEVGDISKAINSWTTLDASKSSCFEALVSLCDQTGNWFRISGRTVDVYAEPLQDAPIHFMFQGDPAPRGVVRAAGTSRIIGQLSIETVSDQVYAGVFPEGSSYQDPQGINRVLRLTGKETVPDGYILANLWGFWGVFDESKTGPTPMSILPDGLIRSEVFGGIYPIINMDESVDGVVERVSGLTIKAAAFDGFEPDHWKDAKTSVGETETTVTASADDVITLATMLPLKVGDNISLSVFRPWSEERLAESQQSLATATVAYLRDRRDSQVSIQVTTPLSDAVLRPGDKVHLRYTGGAVIRNGSIESYVPSMALSGEYAIASVTLGLQDGVETENYSMAANLWRWPSSSGLREIMSILSRRMPNAANGTAGGGYTLQFIVACGPNSAACAGNGRLGRTSFGVTFHQPPQISAVEVLAAGYIASATTTTTAVSVCLRGSAITSTIYVRVTIIAGPTVGSAGSAGTLEAGETETQASLVVLDDPGGQFYASDVESALFELAGGTALMSRSIKSDRVDWGLDANQVNAADVPFVNAKRVLAAANVEEAITELFEITQQPAVVGRIVTGNTAIEQNDTHVVCDSAAPMDVQLPPASGSWRSLSVSSLGAGIVSVLADGADLIGDLTKVSVAQYETTRVRDCAPGTWLVIASS